MAGYRVLLPAETGGVNADLKAVAGTQYETGAQDVSNFWLYKLVVDIDVEGAVTVGTVKVTIQNLAPDGTTVIDTLDAVTAASTMVDGKIRLTWGGGVTGLLVGLGTVSGDLDIMKTFHTMNVILEIVTASDAATSCVANTHLQMEG